MQYSFGLIFSGNPKKTQRDQIYFKVCNSVCKETTHKPSNEVTAKDFFSNVHVTVTTCFDECFLFHVITEGHCVLYTFIVALRSLQPPCSFTLLTL